MVTRKGMTRRSERGFAMALALITVAILFFAAIIMLQYTTNAAGDASSLQFKQTAFDAAEAGLNDGIRALDASNGVTATGTTGSGTLSNTNGGYTWKMIVNNLAGATATAAPSPAPGVTVPPHSAYISSDGNLTGQRHQIVGAIIGKATGIGVPGGAIDANQNVVEGSHANINHAADGTPADVHSNGNITVGGNPGTVQGSTYAVGTDSWTGQNGTHAGAAAVALPSNQQVSVITSTALGLAKTGTTISTTSPSGSYSGNVYVSNGISMGNGTLTFTGGGTIYINGSVSLSGHASIVNQNGSLIVVNGTFSTSGQSTFSAPVGSGGQMIVLAADPNPSNCASGTPSACAVDIAGNGSSVGLIFTPYGSIDMAGNGTITGALLAGGNILFNGGGSGGTFVYDPVAGTSNINANNYTASSYIEN